MITKDPFVTERDDQRAGASDASARFDLIWSLFRAHGSTTGICRLPLSRRMIFRAAAIESKLQTNRKYRMENGI